MIDYRDSVLMHSIVHQDQGPQRLKEFVSYRADISERATRASSAGLLGTRRYRLEAARMSVPDRAVRAWNRLPASVRSSTTCSFKMNVKRALLEA